MKLHASVTTLLALLALPACGDDMDMTTDPTTTGSPTGDPTGATDPTTTAGPTTDPTTTNGPTDPTTTTDATTTTDPTMTDPTMTDPTTTTDPTTGDLTTGGAGLSFAVDVWDPILGPSCSCHQLGSSGGLMMGSDAAAAFAALVGVPSNGSPLNYVEAGSSDMSYIYHKVNNTQVEAGGGGGRMPLGGMLTPDQIATIKQWIDDGALP